MRTAALWIVALAAALAATSAAAQFATAPVTGGFVDTPYRYDVEAATGAQGPTTIVATSALPDWLTLEGTGDGRATLHGTPPQTGVFRIALRAQSSGCAFFVFFCPSQVFDLVVAPKPNRSPVVVAPGIPDLAVTQGAAVAVDVRPAFSDPDGDALVYGAAGLPNGITINGGIIAGTAPNVAAEQAFNVTVTASDGRGGTVSDAFALRISPPSRADIYVSGIGTAPAAVGSPVEIVVQYGNAGPTPSGNGVLTVTLAGTALTLTENPCAVTTSAAHETLTCNVAPLGAGGTASITLRGSAAAVGDVFVTAALAGAADAPPDPNAANNSAAAALNVGTTIVAEPAQTLSSAATRAVAGGDLDGDGFDDVVAATGAGEAALLLRNVADPSGLHAALTVPGRSNRGLSAAGVRIGNTALGNDAALADLDNDGDLDLALANGPGRPSGAFRNTTGTLQTFGALGAAGSDDRAVALGDVDGDGFVDAVVGRADGVRLYRNVGGTQLAESAVATAAASAVDVHLAQLVGSALPELVVVRGDGSVVVHDNLGGGTFGAATTVDAGPAVAVASADFNRDGNGDLVVARLAPAASGVPANTVYAGNGAGTFTAVAELGASPTIAVAVGDLDGDGDADVVAVNATDAHQAFINAGDGTFAQHGRLLVSPHASAAALVPLGAAGALDLVVGGDDGLRVFFNDRIGNLGLGDLEGPVITLNGTAVVTIQAGTGYADPGATAIDAVDGPVALVVDNGVDANVIGSYTVTYSAQDRAGNAAQPVTRTVHVAARAADGGGGGGAVGLELALLAAAAALVLRARSSRRRAA